MEEARVAQVNDLDRLAQLLQQASAATPRRRGGELFRLASRTESPRERLERLLGDDNSALVLCGLIEGYIVGVAVAVLDYRYGTQALGVIEELWVEPEARNVGVGEALLEGSVAWCRTHGCVGVDLEALPGDRSTKNLCERWGFTARLLVMHRALGERPPGERPARELPDR